MLVCLAQGFFKENMVVVEPVGKRWSEEQDYEALVIKSSLGHRANVLDEVLGLL